MFLKNFLKQTVSEGVLRDEEIFLLKNVYCSRSMI